MAENGRPRDQTMNDVLTGDELERLRAGLGDLPDTVPPRAVWHRIREQAEAEGLLAESKSVRRIRWFVGAGVAAAVALAVLRVPDAVGPVSGEPGPDVTLRATPTHEQDLRVLMERSRQLEQFLRDVPYQPRVMRASTAATISNLEDRIAAIDYQLNNPAIRMSPAEQQQYWRERVRLMDSLVKLRYAQAQRASF